MNYRRIGDKVIKYKEIGETFTTEYANNQLPRTLKNKLSAIASCLSHDDRFEIDKEVTVKGMKYYKMKIWKRVK